MIKVFPISPVDFFNNHIYSGQQTLHQINRPSLQGLRHNGMIGEGHGLHCDLPSFIPFQMLLIQKYPDQFRHTKSRMGIVGMDRYFFRKFCPVVSAISKFVIFNNGGDSGSYEEILLFQTQLPACQSRLGKG